MDSTQLLSARNAYTTTSQSQANTTATVEVSQYDNSSSITRDNIDGDIQDENDIYEAMPLVCAQMTQHCSVFGRAKSTLMSALIFK